MPSSISRGAGVGKNSLEDHSVFRPESSGAGCRGNGWSDGREALARVRRPAEVTLAVLTVNRHEAWVPVLRCELDVPQEQRPWAS